MTEAKKMRLKSLNSLNFEAKMQIATNFDVILKKVYFVQSFKFFGVKKCIAPKSKLFFSPLGEMSPLKHSLLQYTF